MNTTPDPIDALKHAEDLALQILSDMADREDDTAEVTYNTISAIYTALRQYRADKIVIERADVPDGLDKAVEKYKDSRWRDMGYLRKCVEAAALFTADDVLKGGE